MKKVISFLLSLVCLSAYPQLELKDFKHDPNDIDAVNSPKEDFNHVICALVKVGLAEPGAIFEGDIIGTPEYKNGEYWVYLTDGATWLNIKTKNYAPLRYDFPQPVNSKNTYVMLIIKPISDIPTGTINIRTTPKNVDIYIDGVKHSSVTPYAYKGTEGQHIIEFKAAGYVDEKRTVSVVLGKTTSLLVNLNSGESLNINGITYGIANVSANTFEMGSPRFYYESPKHEVSLRPFSIGKRPVPSALWNEVMGTNHERNNGPNGEVVNITYEEVQDFLTLLNQGQNRHFRLPTEAEWEYVATHASQLGVEDIGNTMEWCSDWFGHYLPANQTSPTGPEQGFLKVVRGGSLYGDNSWYKVPTYRWHQAPDTPSEKIGLRLVEDR